VRCIEGWIEGSGARVSPSEELGTFRIELDLPRERWSSPGEFVFRSELHLGFDIRFLSAGSVALFAGEEPLVQIDKQAFDRGDEGFLVRSAELTLRVPRGANLPDDLRLVVSYPLAEHEGGEWRALVGGCSGAGIAVPSGTSVELTTDIHPGSYLRFHAIGEPLAGHSFRMKESRLVFRVHVNDTLVFEKSELVHRIGKGAAHEVRMPEEGERGARLRFSVEGAPAVAAFFQPTLGPLAIDARRRDPRPDMVLVVLDTMRADGLSFYGGDPDVAPRINAFAEKSVRFSRAWSSASWTLPSHGSMMSGLHPEQHGAKFKDQSLSEAHLTLAEYLRSTGYRTMAVTEGLFVSRQHGMDQGFEVFVANGLRILTHTLEKAQAFLDADDGRPTFLFLHTYRAHTPYRLGAEADASAYHELLSEMNAWRGRYDRELMQHEFSRRLRELYFAGVNALDKEMGEWLEELEVAGFYENGFLLLTSDHGDELLEHGRMGHGHRHWEELTRVPLLLRGKGLEPRTFEYPVTLVDLAPTFTELAGLPTPDVWVGRSLLASGGKRAVFTFNSGPQERWLTIHDQDRKLFAEMDSESLRRGELRGAYDLAQDPHEREDLNSEDPPWALELLRRETPLLLELMRPKATADQVEFSKEELVQLRALGYGDG